MTHRSCDIIKGGSWSDRSLTFESIPMPGFDASEIEHDVFVSYARVDDMPFEAGDEDTAWVSALVRRLKWWLGQKMRRADWGEVWQDLGMRGSDAVTPEIEHAVRHSATLLVILSDAYLESRWCMAELAMFLEAGPDAALAKRIFVVQRSEVERRRWPQPLRDLRGYEFFRKEPSGGPARTLALPKLEDGEKLYVRRLEDLAEDLAKRLRSLRSPATASDTVSEEGDATVFLAEVTPDLEEQRDEVGRYLTQAGLGILPASYYQRAPEAFRAALDRDLEHSDLFVQLLGRYRYPTVEGLPSGYEGLQLERARAAGQPILRWRSSQLDPATVKNLEHRAELEGADVIAMSIEDLKSEIERQARRLIDQRTGVGMGADTGDAYVLISADRSDVQIADEISEILDGNRIGFDIEVGATSLVERAREESFDGLMVVYGRCPQDWAQRQVRQCRVVMLGARPRPPVCAVYLGAADSREPLRTRPPRMQLLKGSGEAGLRPFVEAVSTRVAGG